MIRFRWLAVALLATPAAARAQGDGVVGDWRTPEKAVVRIAPCGSDLCATLVRLAPAVDARVDSNNPDPAKRGQKLCGLQIGYGFHLVDPRHADEGRLYDPKSGKTYRGTMASQGDELSLRGYVGMKAFGRTETWTRVPKSAESCS